MSKIDGNTALAAVMMLQMIEKKRAFAFPNPDKEEKWLAETYKKCLDVVSGEGPAIIVVPWYEGDLESAIKDLRNTFAGMTNLDRDFIEYFGYKFPEDVWEVFRQCPWAAFLKLPDEGQAAVASALKSRISAGAKS